jgi:hypothetical protein
LVSVSAALFAACGGGHDSSGAKSTTTTAPPTTAAGCRDAVCAVGTWTVTDVESAPQPGGG